MKYIHYSFIIIILFLIYGCPFERSKYYEDIWVINKSSQDIYFDFRPFYLDDSCPDTLLPTENTSSLIRKNQPKNFEFSHPECDTIRIFLIHVDTLEKYSWEELRASYNILRRYDLNWRKLADIQWAITFTDDDIRKY